MRLALVMSVLILGMAPIVACPGTGMYDEIDPNENLPRTSAALYEYLEAGRYKGFEHGTVQQDPTGAHGINVVYLNMKLVESLSSNNDQHPAGSAAVKEFYDENATLVAWAVMMKQRDGTEGTAWFWYEARRGPSGADNPDYAGDGSGPCVPCHSLGRGLIRVEFPLQ